MNGFAFHDHRSVRGPVRRLPAWLKLILALAVVLATVSLPGDQFKGLAIIAAVVLVAIVVSGMPVGALLKRLLWLEPLVIGVAVLMLFQEHGGLLFCGVLLKTNLCLTATILLSATTPFSELLQVLRRCHVPWVMISTIALMHRYLFVLSDEAERMRRARASRTYTARQRLQWAALATVIGQLFIRASARAERIYAAMSARGWK